MSKNTKSLLLIDTGFWVALFSRTDTDHNAAIALKPVIHQRRWITTWPVLTEVCHLLQKKPQLADAVFTLFVRDAFTIFEMGKQHVPRIQELMEKYKKLPMDLADASLVIAAEEMDCHDIVSTDRRDFGIYRFKNHKPFHNLMN